MKTQDKRRFADLLAELAEFYEKPAMNAAKLKMYWGALEAFPIEAIEKAKDMHLADPNQGAFMPKPSHLIQKIQEAVDMATGRPSADEAWALALKAQDEAETVIWTEDIAQAFGAAKEILDCGDKIGARMAFRAAYERIVSKSIAPAVWVVSLGHDSQRRVEAIGEAVDTGLLTHERAEKYLPAPEPTSEGKAIAGLLTGKVVPLHANEETKRRLAEIKAAIKQKPEEIQQPVELSEESEKEALERLEQR